MLFRSYGAGSGRNPSSYAPYYGEDTGPLEEIEAEPAPTRTVGASVMLDPHTESTAPLMTQATLTAPQVPVDSTTPVPPPPSPDHELLGEIPNVNIEPLPHSRIQVHTPTSSASKDILDALQSHGVFPHPSPIQDSPPMTAIAALTNLVCQLVSPMVQHHALENKIGRAHV